MFYFLKFVRNLVFALAYAWVACHGPVWLETPVSVKAQADVCGCVGQTCCASGKCCCAPEDDHAHDEGPAFSQCDTENLPHRTKVASSPAIPPSGMPVPGEPDWRLLPWPPLAWKVLTRSMDPPDKIPIP